MKSVIFGRGWRCWRSVQSAALVVMMGLMAACGQSSDDGVAVSPGALAPANATSPAALGLSGEIWIENRSNDLYVDFGRYTQMEFQLRGNFTGSVNWNILEATVPAGLSLRSNSGDSVMIAGTPEFTGQWCFVLGAEARSSNWDTIRTFKDVCFIGNDFSSGRIRFQTDRYLPVATRGQFYSQDILIDTGYSRSYRGTQESGNLPYGMTVRSDDWCKKFVVSGRADQTGMSRFVLRITDDMGQSVSRQFQLTVEESSTGGQQCPPGYYFDNYLGYCVSSGTERCSSGYYWDSYLNRCVPYGSPPPGYSCSPGYYYDSYLGRCVLLSSERCPVNYEWDSYYGKCVRSPYSCPVGYTYSWVTRECVRSTPSCPSGYYYDSYRDQCLPYSQSCPSGQYWDSVLRRCVSSGTSCPPGTHWDYSANRCVSNVTQCPPGTTWDSYLRECRRNTPPPTCAPGYYWSNVENRCVRYSTPPPGTGGGSGGGPGHGGGSGGGPGSGHGGSGSGGGGLNCPPGTHPEGGRCVSNASGTGRG